MTRFSSQLHAIVLIAVLSAASQGHAGLLTDDGTIVLVVINHEEQYSIVPVGQPVPDGWKSTGKTCGKSECLKYIEEVWTDMRPLAIRQFVEKQLRQHLKDQ